MSEPQIPVERARQFLAAVRGHAQMIAETAASQAPTHAVAGVVREDARLIIRATDALEALCREAVAAYRLANGPTTCAGGSPYTEVR